MSDIHYLQIAKASIPEGEFCGHCGQINDFVDDCGWFEFDGKIGCHKCWWGKHGETHRKKYGTGDR